MARSGYITLTSEIEEKYFSGLQSGDRFTFPRISKKIALMSFRRKRGVSARSLLPACAEIWNAYTTEEKQAWNDAGAFCNLTGWKLFVKDKCFRMVNDLIGEAVPNNFHQALIGQLFIGGTDDEMKIFQPHPYEYYISKKISGFKNMYSPFLIRERLRLPFQIGLSYKSDLETTEAGGYAKFYAIVRRLYQGRNINEVLEINLDLQSDWKTETATLSFILGQYTSYSLYLHLYKVRGSLYIDNVKAIHSGQNWTRDFACNDINQVFTRAYYQIPKHWTALTLQPDSFFESIYPLD